MRSLEPYEHEGRESRRVVTEAVRRLVKERPFRTPFPSEDWPEFTRYLKRRNLDPALARANGWFPSRCAGDSELRIVIPGTETDRGVFWQARAVSRGVAKRYESPHGSSGDSIIVVYPADYSTTRAVVVEGPTDALAAAMEGWVGYALMGNTPSGERLDHLFRRLVASETVKALSDRDAEGHMGIVVGYLTGRGVRCIMITPEPHKDLAEANREERRSILSR